MQSEILLRLRSSGPGLPGPYLEESLAPYQLSGECILLDSGLHQYEGDLPRINGGPVPGHYCYHELKAAHGSPHQIADKLVYRLFSHFSDVNVIFIQDFGGIRRTVELLCCWALFAEGVSRQQDTALVLIQDQPLSLEHVRFEMTVQLLDMIRSRDPGRQISAAEIKILIARTFSFYYMSSRAPLHALLQLATSQAEGRRRRGFELSGAHTKTLVRRAISQFARTPHQSLPLVELSRERSPVPKTLQEHITATLLANRNQAMEACDVLVASALSLDAVLGGGHCFPASEVFDILYSRDVLACERETNLFGFAYRIRSLFLGFMQAAKMRPALLATDHLDRSRAWLGTGAQVAQVSGTTSKRRAGVFSPPACVVCLTPNTAWLKMLPPTAGTSTLQLGGGAVRKTEEFIRAIQMFGGLKYVPIYEQFDFVRAKDTGMRL
ncbi:hypothetical protein NLG97_g1512 [Lecanicillium saksenae]|uniref:Uncharacterized protein n=1 Tax=Lecanicillium saksenae TaxID=468837 RepID=A0ACC1R675_9HYPO|nr:hypothetical protein NLG97_g1512 [Lecanicillium saksenae]